MNKNCNEYNDNFKTCLVIKLFHPYVFLTYFYVANMREFNPESQMMLSQRMWGKLERSHKFSRI